MSKKRYKNIFKSLIKNGSNINEEKIKKKIKLL